MAKLYFKMKILFFALLFLSGNVDSQLIKRWTRDTNFDNPDNWNEGWRLPCPNEEIDFPFTCPVVLIKQDYSFKQLRLPANGMIVLERDLTFVFNDHPSTDDTSCNKTRGITFVSDHFHQWMDPQNWCVPKFDMGPDCMDPDLFLDSERVPCELDDVLFPGESSFYVGMTWPQDVNVRSFKIGNVPFTSDSLEVYFKTLIGSSMFRRNQPPVTPLNRVYISNNACFNNTGCMCGNDFGWKLDHICRNMRNSLECNTVSCTDSLIPIGHCCPVCGSMIEMDYASGFSPIHLKQFLHSTFIDGKYAPYPGVKVIVSKRHDDKIQLVLRDDTPQGYKAARLGPLVVDKINEDLQMHGIVRVISIRTSHAPPTTTAPTSPPTSGSGPTPSVTNIPPGGMTTSEPTKGENGTKTEALSVEAIAGLSSAGVAIFILILLAAVCLLTRNWRPTSLLPFKKQFRPDVTYPSVSADFSDPTNPSVRGFDNPMYGESPSQGTQLQEMHSNRLSAVPTAGFDNPLYDSPLDEGSLYSDPSRAESSVRVNPVYSTMGIEEETNA